MCMNILVKFATVAELISLVFYFEVLCLLRVANLKLREIKSETLVGKFFLAQLTYRWIVCVRICVALGSGTPSI